MMLAVKKLWECKNCFKSHFHCQNSSQRHLPNYLQPFGICPINFFEFDFIVQGSKGKYTWILTIAFDGVFMEETLRT
jgi:hypothetical protein